VIPLYGAMELAPLMNLADEIVDIVDTGNTLRANGLVPLEHIRCQHPFCCKQSGHANSTHVAYRHY